MYQLFKKNFKILLKNEIVSVLGAGVTQSYYYLCDARSENYHEFSFLKFFVEGSDIFNFCGIVHVIIKFNELPKILVMPKKKNEKILSLKFNKQTKLIL